MRPNFILLLILTMFFSHFSMCQSIAEFYNNGVRTKVFLNNSKDSLLISLKNESNLNILLSKSACPGFIVRENSQEDEKQLICVGVSRMCFIEGSGDLKTIRSNDSMNFQFPIKPHKKNISIALSYAIYKDKKKVLVYQSRTDLDYFKIHWDFVSNQFTFKL